VGEDFLGGGRNILARRAAGPVAVPNNIYQRWSVAVTAGKTKSDTSDKDTDKLPHCELGAWDNGGFDDFLNELSSLGADDFEPVCQDLSVFVAGRCVLIRENRIDRWIAAGFAE